MQCGGVYQMIIQSIQNSVVCIGHLNTSSVRLSLLTFSSLGERALADQHRMVSHLNNP